MVTPARILINSCWCSTRCRTPTPPLPRTKPSSPFAKQALARCCGEFPSRLAADFRDRRSRDQTHGGSYPTPAMFTFTESSRGHPRPWDVQASVLSGIIRPTGWLRRRGWRGRLNHWRHLATDRCIGILHRFSRTPQAGSIRRFLLRCLGHAGRRLEIDLFRSPESLAAVHLHSFDAHHFIAYQTHEVDVLGRLPVDPVFVLGLSILLANLFGWATLSINQHLA